MAQAASSHREESPQQSPSASPRGSRSVLRRGLLVAAALVVLATVFAPQIVCRTPLLNRLVAAATPASSGRIHVGRAALGWFSPPSAEDLEWTDVRGQTVVRAAALSGERTLWNLLTAPQQLGRIRLDRPELQLVVRADGTTNLEEVLAAFFLEPSGAIDSAIEIVDGTATIRDEATGRRWTLDGLNGVAVLPASADVPLSFDARGTILVGGARQPVVAHLLFRDGAADAATFAPQGDASFSVAALPLELVQAFARRGCAGLELGGLVAGEGKAKFDLAASSPTAGIEARLRADDLVVGGPWSAGDQIRLAHVDVPVKASAVGDRLTIERLGAVCDLAQFDGQGAVDDYRVPMFGGSTIDWRTLLRRSTGSATLKFDIARLGQAMPHLLRLRDDVQLTAGQATVGVRSGADAQGVRRWTIDLASTGLGGVRANTPIAWPEPLSATIGAVDSPAGPTLDRVACRSDFLTIEGTGSARAFDLKANFDLQRLFDRVSQFVDLTGVQLQGQGTAEAACTRDAAGRFTVDATAAVADFRLSSPGIPAWTERQLVFGVQCVGLASGVGAMALEQATLGLQSGDDQLTVKLSEPQINLFTVDAAWPLRIDGRGELSRWLTRLRPLVDFPAGLDVAGNGELTATGRLRLPDDVEITESKLAVRPLRATYDGLTIDEPTADLTLAGRYRTSQTEVRDALLLTPSLAVQLRNVVWSAPAGRSPELTGEAGVRADLARIQALLLGPTPSALRTSGMLEAVARLQQTGSVIGVSLDATTKDLVVTQGAETTWREPQVRVVGSGVYEPQRDSVAIDRLELTADALRLRLNGKLHQLSTTRDVRLSGEADYDLARLTPIVQTYLGRGVALSGRDTQGFELSGPTAAPLGASLPWEKLSGAARLGWDQLNLYGLQTGKQTLDARMSQGLVRVAPLSVAAGGGRLRIAPALQLAPQPKTLHLEPGILADHVAITPEMANEQMKYVMPILAGVANVSGAFSVVIDDLRLPLDDPASGSLSGKLTVHAVDVGPGYITQELATLLQQPLKMSLTRESTVDFKMIQGRVYHQNLEFAFPDVVVRTHGSVGVADQSLSLVAEMPIPAKLLGPVPALQTALANQTIRVPIGGTLSRPTLDVAAFQQVAAQFTRNAVQGLLNQGVNNAETAVDKEMQKAEGTLRDGINRGLDRLLGPAGALNPLAPRQK